MKSLKLKRKRLLECKKCGKQESMTADTIFHSTKLPLLKWFWAFYLISQTKKGISGCALSRKIKVSESTALLMLYKIRKVMEEAAITYQIGGPESIVDADEIEIGGVGSTKQNVLILLEKSKKTGKLGRVRFAPMVDKTVKSLELQLIPQIAKATELRTDGKNTYKRLAQKYFKNFDLKQMAHWEENHTYYFLRDLNTIVGNLKTWYRGTHHHFALKNVSYYLNEFAYRFNRRRSESNIFDRLLNRAVIRPKILKLRDLYKASQYMPLAS